VAGTLSLLRYDAFTIALHCLLTNKTHMPASHTMRICTVSTADVIVSVTVCIAYVYTYIVPYMHTMFAAIHAKQMTVGRDNELIIDHALIARAILETSGQPTVLPPRYATCGMQVYCTVKPLCILQLSNA
jgi:hypothetical protein